MADSTGLLGISPENLTRGIAQYFLGEQVGDDSTGRRSGGEAARTAMAGLLGAAQGIGASGALSPTYLPFRTSPVAAVSAGLAGGMQSAQAQDLYNFQAQQMALARGAALREQERRARVRAFLGQQIGMAPPSTGTAPGVTRTAGVGQVPVPGDDAAPADPAAPITLDAAAGLPVISAFGAPQRSLFGTAVTEAGLTPAQATVFGRMIVRESGGRHTRDNGEVRVSPAGARGIAQVMPGTYAELAQRHQLEGGIDDEASNMRAGARYFRQMLDQFNGNIEHAAGAYNAGPNRFRAAIAGTRPMPVETSDYLRAVVGAPGAPSGGGGPGTAPPRNDAAVTALAAGAGIARPQAETLLGLSPQDAMMLLMLSDEDMSRALTEILKQRAGGGGFEQISRDQARTMGLPNPDTTAYQRATRGENAGRIYEVGGGGTRITLERQGEDRLQALDIGRLGRTREAAEAGQQIMPQLRVMQEALLSGVETGAIPAARTAVGNYLEAIGALGRGQAQQLNQARLFQSLVAQVVPNMRPVGAGSTSDRDLALFQQAAPQMVNTPVGNLMILGSMMQVREAQQREAEQMEEFFRRTGSLNGYAEHARGQNVVAFPRITDDEAGRALAAQQRPGTVVVLPNGQLGVKLSNGAFDDGSGAVYDRARREQQGRR